LGKNLGSAGAGNRWQTNTNKQQQTSPPVAEYLDVVEQSYL
jgi:hypothetical protein